MKKTDPSSKKPGGDPTKESANMELAPPHGPYFSTAGFRRPLAASQTPSSGTHAPSAGSRASGAEPTSIASTSHRASEHSTTHANYPTNPLTGARLYQLVDDVNEEDLGGVKPEAGEQSEADLGEQARIAELDLGMTRRETVVGGDAEIGHGGLHRMNTPGANRWTKPGYDMKEALRLQNLAMERASHYKRNHMTPPKWNDYEYIVGSARYAVRGGNMPLIDDDIDPRPKVRPTADTDLKFGETVKARETFKFGEAAELVDTPEVEKPAESNDTPKVDETAKIRKTARANETVEAATKDEENVDAIKTKTFSTMSNQHKPLFGPDAYTSFDEETSVAFREQLLAEMRNSSWAVKDIVGDSTMTPRNRHETFLVDLLHEMLVDEEAYPPRADEIDNNILRRTLDNVASHRYQNVGQIREGITRGVRAFAEQTANTGDFDEATAAITRLLAQYDKNKEAKEMVALRIMEEELKKSPEHLRAGESRVSGLFRRATEGQRNMETNNATEAKKAADTKKAAEEKDTADAKQAAEAEKVCGSSARSTGTTIANSEIQSQYHGVKRQRIDSLGPLVAPFSSRGHEVVDNSRRINTSAGQPGLGTGGRMILPHRDHPLHRDGPERVNPWGFLGSSSLRQQPTNETISNPLRELPKTNNETKPEQKSEAKPDTKPNAKEASDTKKDTSLTASKWADPKFEPGNYSAW